MKIVSNETKTSTNLSTSIVDLLVKQIASELYNHNVYMYFANHFKVKGLEKLSEYYRLRAQEEYNHHLWITSYLDANHINYCYPAIDAVEQDFIDDSNDISTFEITLDLEKDTTESIYTIYQEAEKQNDYKTLAWLNSPHMLIQEQLEEEHVSETILKIAKQEDSWLSKEQAILEAYQKIS